MKRLVLVGALVGALGAGVGHAQTAESQEKPARKARTGSGAAYKREHIYRKVHGNLVAGAKQNIRRGIHPDGHQRISVSAHHQRDGSLAVDRSAFDLLDCLIEQAVPE